MTSGPLSCAKSAAKTLGFLALFLQLACSSEGDSPGSAGSSAVAGAGGAPLGGSGAASAGAPGLGGGGSPSGSGGSVSGGASTSGAPSVAGAPAAGRGGTGAGGSASGGGGAGGASGGAASGAAGKGGAGGSAGSAAGGATSGGTGSGGGASAGFAPCPESEPCKVLPLGDSITVGLTYESGGGYRQHLFHLAHEDGHEITFTGTQAPNGPMMVDGVPFPRNHAGISGQTISQIAGRIPNPDFKEIPHIVLLHAGTNDMYQMPSGAIGRLEALIDELIMLAPNALIVVGNIIPFPMAASTVSSFNMPIPDLVKKKADAGSHVLFVDQFKDFPTSELSDGVHPNKAGYERMATKWYSAIEPYLR